MHQEGSHRVDVEVDSQHEVAVEGSEAEEVEETDCSPERTMVFFGALVFLCLYSCHAVSSCILSHFNSLGFALMSDHDDDLSRLSLQSRHHLNSVDGYSFCQNLPVRV